MENSSSTSHCERQLKSIALRETAQAHRVVEGSSSASRRARYRSCILLSMAVPAIGSSNESRHLEVGRVDYCSHGQHMQHTRTLTSRSGTCRLLQSWSTRSARTRADISKWDVLTCTVMVVKLGTHARTPTSRSGTCRLLKPWSARTHADISKWDMSATAAMVSTLSTHAR